MISTIIVCSPARLEFADPGDGVPATCAAFPGPEQAHAYYYDLAANRAENPGANASSPSAHRAALRQLPLQVTVKKEIRKKISGGFRRASDND
jgi:hypothetical protein